MIKILFFIETLQGGGAEKVLCNLVNHMDKSRFQITVQTLYREEVSLASGIEYKYCYPSGNRFYSMIKRAEAALGLTYSIHIRGEYDIEVAYLECGATKIMAGSTNKKAKKIAWVHCDLQNIICDPQEFAKQTKKYYQQFDQVACVSERVKQSFTELFGQNPEAMVVHNVIDNLEIIKKAQQPLPEGLEKRRMTVTLVGRLTPPKKIERILAAHRRLLDDGYDFDLWIVGEGEERAKIESKIKELELEQRVTLFGFKSNPYPFMYNADLLACSSVFEGFSTFITEGLILGKPIVTTDVSGMRELLGDSEYGLITANDDEDFYQGLKRMIADDDLRAHYQRQAEVRGKSFHTDILVKENETFLHKMLL